MKNFFKLSMLLITTLIATFMFNPMQAYAASCNGSHTWKLLESYKLNGDTIGSYQCTVCGEERTVNTDKCTDHEAKSTPRYQENGKVCLAVYECKFCKATVYTKDESHNMENNPYGVMTCTKCKKIDENDFSTPSNEKLHNAECGADYEYEYIKKATCTSKGKAIKKCKYCPYKEEVVIRETAHDYVPNGTCGQRYCSVCGTAKANDTTAKHTFSSYTTKAATCEVNGEKKIKCTKCSYFYTETIEKTGHNYVVDEIVKGTCKVQGMTYKKCTKCGDKDTIPGEYGDHSFGPYTVKKEPTCTNPGKKQAKCQREGCGVSSKEETIPALGHSSSNEKITKKATCTTDGERKGTCSVCKKAYTEKIYATGHTPVNGGKKNVHSKCKTCKETLSTSHSYTVDSGVQYKAATCTSARKNYKKCACGYNPKSSSYVVSIGSPLGHTSVNGGTKDVHTKCKTCKITLKTSHSYTVDSGTKYKSATCTTPRYNYKKCSCGYNPKSASYIISSGSANGHNYKSKVTTKATCTKAGVKTYTCSSCKDAYTETIKATGHTSVYAGKSNIHTKCSTCGVTISKSHSYTVDSGVQYKAATCTEARKNYKKCACGYNPKSSSYIVSSGSAKGHTSKYVGTAATHSKCSTCNKVLVTGHNYTVDSGVQYKAASCTSARKNYKKCACGYNPKSSAYVVSVGTTVHTSVNGGTASAHTKCSKCGITTSTSHSYTVDSKVKYKSATCTAPQYNYKKCSCGYNPKSSSYIVSSGSKLGHSYTGSTVVKAATCSATGTRRYDCNRCTYSYTSTIEKKAHSYTSKVTKNATCSSTGTRKYTCSKCSYSYTESIAKVAHTYTSKTTKNPTCTSTGTKKYTCTKCSYSYTSTIAKKSHSYNLFGKCACGAKK